MEDSQRLYELEAMVKRMEDEKNRAEIKAEIRAAMEDQKISKKSRTARFLLSFFFGLLGFHRMYAGKVASGILQLLFGWLTLFIWNQIDFILIICGAFKDAEGKVIKNW